MGEAKRRGSEARRAAHQGLRDARIARLEQTVEYLTETVHQLRDMQRLLLEQQADQMLKTLFTMRFFKTRRKIKQTIITGEPDQVIEMTLEQHFEEMRDEFLAARMAELAAMQEAEAKAAADEQGVSESASDPVLEPDPGNERLDPDDLAAARGLEKGTDGRLRLARRDGEPTTH